MIGANGFTVTVNDFVSLKGGVLLSVTLTCTVLVVLAAATPGRQLNRPLVALRVALAGGANKLNVSVRLESLSVAVAVKVTICPALTV